MGVVTHLKQYFLSKGNNQSDKVIDVQIYVLSSVIVEKNNLILSEGSRKSCDTSEKFE